MKTQMLDITVVLGPRSLGMTLRAADGVTLYADLPRPEGGERMSEDELTELARTHARIVFRAAAEALD